MRWRVSRDSGAVVWRRTRPTVFVTWGDIFSHGSVVKQLTAASCLYGCSGSLAMIQLSGLIAMAMHYGLRLRWQRYAKWILRYGHNTCDNPSVWRMRNPHP